MEKIPTRAHALLKASSAVRWINCPPSARLEDEYEDESSEYAKEGTVAHALAALQLKQALNLVTEEEYNNELNSIKGITQQLKTKVKTIFKEEMFDYVGEYVDLVMDLYNEEKSKYGDEVKIYIEKLVWFDHIAPEGFGTCDCGIVSPEKYIVIDFKYGRGVGVSAEKNPQLLLYGFGFMKENGDEVGERLLETYISQPRSRFKTFSEDEYLPTRLKYWKGVLKKAAMIAYVGEGEKNCGDWCRFCNHKEDCEEYNQWN